MSAQSLVDTLVSVAAIKMNTSRGNRRTSDRRRGLASQSALSGCTFSGGLVRAQWSQRPNQAVRESEDWKDRLARPGATGQRAQQITVAVPSAGDVGQAGRDDRERLRRRLVR